MPTSYEVDAVTYDGTVSVLFAHGVDGHEVAIAAEPRIARDIETALDFGRRPNRRRRALAGPLWRARRDGGPVTAHAHHTHPEMDRAWCCCGYNYPPEAYPPTDDPAWADIIAAAADADPGETNEPPLCPCGRGYVGHAVHEHTRLVRVSGVALRSPTVWVLEGTEVDTGRAVAFSCEPRYALDLAAEDATPESGPVASVDPRQMMWETR